MLLIGPPYQARGAVSGAILLGGAAGIAGELLLRWIPASSAWAWPRAMVIFGPSLASAVAAALLLTRRRAVVAWVLALSVSHFALLTVTSSLLDPTDRGAAMLLADWPPHGLIPLVLIPLMLAMLLAGVALALRWLAPRVFLRVMEHEPGRCWRCGYRAGAESIPLCPECGTPRGQGQRYRGAFAFARRAKRLARPALAAAALLAFASAVVWSRDQDVRRLAGFYARFGERIGGHVPGSAPIASAWFPLDKADGPGLYVRYAPADHQWVASMELRLSMKGTGAIGVYITPAPASAVCFLDRAQAEYVIAHGIPATLVQAFRDAKRGPAQGVPIATDGHFPP